MWRNVAIIILVVALLLSLVQLIWGIWKTYNEYNELDTDRSTWFNLLVNILVTLSLAFVVGIFFFTSELGKKTIVEGRALLNRARTNLSSRKRE
jgi:hypothetical protein